MINPNQTSQWYMGYQPICISKDNKNHYVYFQGNGDTDVLKKKISYGAIPLEGESVAMRSGSFVTFDGSDFLFQVLFIKEDNAVVYGYKKIFEDASAASAASAVSSDISIPTNKIVTKRKDDKFSKLKDPEQLIETIKDNPLVKGILEIPIISNLFYSATSKNK